MRGVVEVGVEPLEQTSYHRHLWGIAITPTDSLVTVTVDGHRCISTNPDVIAFMRDIKTTLRYANWESTDDIPTDADLAAAILGGP